MTCLLCILCLVSAGFGEIQIVQDVVLDSSVANPHFQHLGVADNGRVALWGSDPAMWPTGWPHAGYFAVYDSAEHQFIWNEVFRNDSVGEAYARCLDVKTTDSAYVVQWSSVIPWDSVGGFFRISYFSLDGDSSNTQQWLVPMRLACLGVLDQDRAYFADLNPYYSFAPHGMITGVNLVTGEIEWQNEVLPYMMDNWNSFYSLRMTIYHELVYIGMWGLPGEGAYQLGIVNPQSGQQYAYHLIAGWDSVRVKDVLEIAAGDLWIIGTTYHAPRQLFLESSADGERVFLPFFSTSDTCSINALLAENSGGVLGTVHTETGASVFQVSPTMNSWWIESGAEPLFSQIEDIVAHPNGGYLALALDYANPPNYHLVHFNVMGNSSGDFTVPPSSFILSAYPNPFNSTVTIHYELPRSSNVELTVFNLLGEQIATLQQGKQDAGVHALNWQPGVGSGIYFVRMNAGSATQMQKLVYLK